MNYKIVIVGAGNMAYHIALNLHRAGVENLQIYNRSETGLKMIMKAIDVQTTTLIQNIWTDVDLYILAVSDDAIANVAQDLGSIISKKAVLAHTSGSCSIDVLSNHSSHFGAFYPLQTLKKGRSVNFEEIPIFISHSTAKTKRILKKVGSLVSDKVIEISDQDRSKLHIPAVLVNNFVNYIYTLASEYCDTEGLDIQHLIPLMEETLRCIKEGTPPDESQTGPAVRNDTKTLSKHRKQLAEYPEQLKLYNYLTKQIKSHYARN